MIAWTLADALVLLNGGMADLRGKTVRTIDEVDPHPVVFRKLALLVIPVGLAGGD